MTSQMYLCLAIFAFMIVGYVVGPKFKISNGVIALCATVLVSFSGLVEPKTVLASYATTNAMQIIGMFIVAAGFNRTQAVKKMSSLVYKVSGGSFRIVLAGYVLMGFALANLGLSPMTTFAIIGPLAASCCADFDISPSKMIFPVALTCIGTAGSLPLGQGAITYATQNGYLESYGYTDYAMELLDPFKGRAIISVIIILYAIFVAPRFCPEQPSVAINLGSVKKKDGKEVPPLDPLREVLGYGIFIVTTLCLIFQKQVLPSAAPWQIAMMGAALVMFTGILNPKEGINAVPVRIVLMLAAAQSVGAALTACGLGDMIGNGIAGALGGTRNGYIIGAAFFIIPFLMTQCMNNASVGNIFRPILILTCKSLGCDPIGPLLLLNAASLTAFMTPMATGTVPIAMDLGGYDQKDLLKMGWLPSIIICVVSVLWVMTIFPAYH